MYQPPRPSLTVCAHDQGGLAAKLEADSLLRRNATRGRTLRKVDSIMPCARHAPDIQYWRGPFRPPRQYCMYVYRSTVLSHSIYYCRCLLQYTCTVVLVIGVGYWASNTVAHLEALRLGTHTADRHADLGAPSECNLVDASTATNRTRYSRSQSRFLAGRKSQKAARSF